VYLLLSSLVLI
jgi:hypothetical protein